MEALESLFDRKLATVRNEIVALKKTWGVKEGFVH